MSTIVDILPDSEYQVRELSRCDSDDQAAEVWGKVVDSADVPPALDRAGLTLRVGVGQNAGVKAFGVSLNVESIIEK